MMKVYKVHNDINGYQFFTGVDEKDASILLGFSCATLAGQWDPPHVRVLDDRLRKGDFYQFMSNSLIMNQRATDALRFHLQAAGEILPIHYKGETYNALNVLNCIDCLDPERIDEAIVKDRFTFIVESLEKSASTLFKIPQMAQTQVFVLEGAKPQVEDFRITVELAQLRCLVFEEVWSERE